MHWLSLYSSLAWLAVGSTASAASLQDIKHVVMIMMENRSFNHYFGTMSGVRGFADPNVLVNSDGVSVWYQNVSGLTDEADYLLPYYLNYLGGEENAIKAQCLCAGDNNWIPTHQAMNNETMDMWAQIDTPQSWGYFMRQDIPYHFALAEAYAVGDTYHCGIASNTDPNRLFWMSGSINVPGGPQPLDAGGVLLDDAQTDGCVGTDLDCLPYQWPAFAQYMDEASVDWQCFQNSYDWATTNQLFYFAAFQNATNDSSLYQRGLVFDGDSGVPAFQARAANGTLPMVSWVFAPGQMQEHSPRAPSDGGYFLSQIVGSVLNGESYNDTVILINYDEAGGWGDSVPPIISPVGTAGEWFQDPYDELGYTFSGPGPRVPLIIVSPYTSGGVVFTERGDHSSILQFLEQFLAAQGYSGDVTLDPQMDAWRRESQSDLVNAFDFDNPNFTIPTLPVPTMPITNSEGEIIGLYDGYCAIQWPSTCSGSEYISGIPYGQQTENNSLIYEDGFKSLRGDLTEGRYLTFESEGYALTNPGTILGIVTATPATSSHSSIQQRWVVHGTTATGTTFQISSAADGRYIGVGGILVDNQAQAEVYTITYVGSSQYTLQAQSSGFLSVLLGGIINVIDPEACNYNIYSVTYSA